MMKIIKETEPMDLSIMIQMAIRDAEPSEMTSNIYYNFEVIMFRFLRKLKFEVDHIIDCVPRLFDELTHDQKQQFKNPERLEDKVLKAINSIPTDTELEKKVHLVLQNIRLKLMLEKVEKN